MSRWVFRRYGFIEHLRLTEVEDLEHIEDLDKARWAATSAPIEQLQCDPDLLRVLDSDGNARIRVEEVKAARRWLWARLVNREGVVAGSRTLQLDAVDRGHADGPGLVALGAFLLERLGESGRGHISVDEIRSFRAAYVSRFPNGDGVVTVAQLPDELKDTAKAVLGATGGAPDLSGEVGVRGEDVDRWLELAAATLAWRHEPDGDGAATLLPLGEGTAAAAATLAALAPKVEQYLAQCALLRLQPGAAARLAPSEAELAALDVADPGAIDAWLDHASLASPTPADELPLTGAVNARFAARLAEVSETIAPALLGRDAPVTRLTAAEWKQLVAALAPYEAWRARKPAGIPDEVTDEALTALAEASEPGALKELCAQDGKAAEELVRFQDLEKLALLQAGFGELVNNFVSFPALFEGDRRSLLEVGTLILDGRRLNLCFRVVDPAAHKKIATLSGIFLCYVDLTRKPGATVETQRIVAAVTAGTRGGIGPGKRGVFYDRQDGEWDALITDVVAEPISVWEAMLAPFLRVRDAVGSRFEKMVGDKAKGLEGEASAKALDSTTAPPAPAAAPAGAPPEAAGGGMAGMQTMLVGGTLAVAAAGSALAFVVQTLAGISLLDVVGALAGLVAAVAAVFGFLGWLRLRRRDLATLLEAGGWALNGRMRLNGHLASLMTRRPGLPAGSVREVRTPRSWAGRIAVLLLLVVLGLVVWAWMDPSVVAWLKPAEEPPPAEVPAAPAEAPPG
ncbi:MAG: hypothetical protein H6732_20180 [Alphaproteobacteria bacterium]|nr:hypothetical protein [Alphaproteobacteria bacterium]